MSIEQVKGRDENQAKPLESYANVINFSSNVNESLKAHSHRQTECRSSTQHNNTGPSSNVLAWPAGHITVTQQINGHFANPHRSFRMNYIYINSYGILRNL